MIHIWRKWCTNSERSPTAEKYSAGGKGNTERLLGLADAFQVVHKAVTVTKAIDDENVAVDAVTAKATVGPSNPITRPRMELTSVPIEEQDWLMPPHTHRESTQAENIPQAESIGMQQPAVAATAEQIGEPITAPERMRKTYSRRIRKGRSPAKSVVKNYKTRKKYMRKYFRTGEMRKSEMA